MVGNNQRQETNYPEDNLFFYRKNATIICSKERFFHDGVSICELFQVQVAVRSFKFHYDASSYLQDKVILSCHLMKT